MRRLLPRGFLALGLLVAAVLAVPATALASGSISGTVTAAVGGAPIAGVRVCAFRPAPEEEEAEEELCTHTDGEGDYRLTPLAAGGWGVDFSAGPEGLNFIYQAWDEKEDRFDAEPVAVGSGDTPAIDAVLLEGGGVSGRVTGAPLGDALGGIEVCAEPEVFPGTEVCATSEADGDYEIVGLGSGEYRLGFHAPEGVEFIEQWYSGEANGWEADLVTVGVGATTSGIDVALQEAGQITGTATDAVTGAPIAGLDVYAFDAFGNEYIHFPVGTTDAAGDYTIPRLAPGSYKVDFWPEEQLPGEYANQWYSCGQETVVTVQAGHATPGIDAAMTRHGIRPCEPPTGPTAAPATSLPPPHLAPVSCRRGFKRRLIGGRRRCVKVHRRSRHHRHRTKNRRHPR